MRLLSSSSLQLTFHDVLHQDLDVLVPVGTTVFVLEAQNMEQLVLDRPEVNAALTAQRNCLAVALAAHAGKASAQILDQTTT